MPNKTNTRHTGESNQIRDMISQDTNQEIDLSIRSGLIHNLAAKRLALFLFTAIQFSAWFYKPK
ncbi:hypothetical protein MED121_06330 [Marinomonas sp. MED121]|nr:hypothetical protein MED121_06330 [Marinomonas sp. MED121]